MCSKVACKCVEVSVVDGHVEHQTLMQGTAVYVLSQTCTTFAFSIKSYHVSLNLSVKCFTKTNHTVTIVRLA